MKTRCATCAKSEGAKFECRCGMRICTSCELSHYERCEAAASILAMQAKQLAALRAGKSGPSAGLVALAKLDALTTRWGTVRPWTLNHYLAEVAAEFGLTSSPGQIRSDLAGILAIHNTLAAPPGKGG